jgi:8-hydroxy-5-deazaflavin:NADPH oxidoreductase
LFARIGIIGSGVVGRSVATRALSARIRVVLSNSRGPDTLSELVDELGEGASAGTVAQAADADLVVVAVPFVKVPRLAGEVPDWSGRVVVDATNQFAQYEPTYTGFVDLGDETGSEWVARHLPGATVIKAFNAMYAE